MRSYDAAWADAAEGMAISNNDMWEVWSARWCQKCRKDPIDVNEQAERGCPLILVALNGRAPREWTPTEPWGYTCSEFDERRDGDEGVPPAPEPDPAQGSLDGLVELYVADLRTEVLV